MLYQTTSYQLDTPSEMWDKFSQLHKDRSKINERLVELVAEDIKEQSDGALNEEVREEIEAVLGGVDDGS